jgi:hypothetical protein
METTPRRNAVQRLAIAAIIVSLLIWPCFLLIPFLPLSGRGKAILGTGMFITSEVLFYGGLLVVGKEVATKYRAYLNPRNWRRRR